MAQNKNIAGTFTTKFGYPSFSVTFNSDSTFEYISNEPPTFYRWEHFSEKGKWTVSGDTAILNPHLSRKTFVESDLKEEENGDDKNLLLTFNHVKRYFDANGNLVKTDTLQIDRLDYALNEWKRKNITRVALQKTTRCAFAGYIPKEIITNKRSVSVPRKDLPKSIFVGCYELQGTKEFAIKNPKASHFTVNVYSNYYQDGQIRQVKFLIRNDHMIYTKQKTNGEFEKDNIWKGPAAKLIQTDPGSL